LPEVRKQGTFVAIDLALLKWISLTIAKCTSPKNWIVGHRGYGKEKEDQHSLEPDPRLRSVSWTLIK